MYLPRLPSGLNCIQPSCTVQFHATLQNTSIPSIVPPYLSANIGIELSAPQLRMHFTLLAGAYCLSEIDFYYFYNFFIWIISGVSSSLADSSFISLKDWLIHLLMYKSSKSTGPAIHSSAFLHDGCVGCRGWQQPTGPVHAAD